MIPNPLDAANLRRADANALEQGSIDAATDLQLTLALVADDHRQLRSVRRQRHEIDAR